MHEGHKVYILDIQYFASFVLSFVCFVVKHILTLKDGILKIYIKITVNLVDKLKY